MYLQPPPHHHHHHHLEISKIEFWKCLVHFFRCLCISIHIWKTIKNLWKVHDYHPVLNCKGPGLFNETDLTQNASKGTLWQSNNHFELAKLKKSIQIINLKVLVFKILVCAYLKVSKCRKQFKVSQKLNKTSIGILEAGYLCNFFIMSTEFDKNISDWSYEFTDHENGIGFFMRLFKWPKIAVKKSQKFRKF